MKNINIIGIDLAKNSLQLHGVDTKGRVVLKKTLKREKVAKFFANLPVCLVGMEACATSAYWARVIESCGHEVRRIHPKFVKPYLISDKNDANDAAAICEAVQRPRMRFVPHKTQKQTDIQAIHRVRDNFVRDRTATINQTRGLLAENGIAIKQGACNARKLLPGIIDDRQNQLSEDMRELLEVLYEHLKHLDVQIATQNTKLQIITKQNDDCKRLMQIPGIGYLTASILLTVTGRPKDFKNGREFAASLGLVPRQFSTGGKSRLLGITKRGNSKVRTLLIHGARSVLRSLKMGRKLYGDGRVTAWLTTLVERRGDNRACVALANKMARIAWNMVAYGTEFKAA